MDEYTPDDYYAASQFNDFMVSAYVENGSVRFGVDIWNAYEAIVNHLPRTNNHVEGNNRRIEAEFPTHPHIYQFMDTSNARLKARSALSRRNRVTKQPPSY